MSEIIVKQGIPRDISSLREIFFESSTKKTFENESQKEDFFYKYLGLYFKNDPTLCFYAEKNGVTIGYCVGLGQTIKTELFEKQPHLKVFQDHYVNFPAHLHMNCDFRYRGQGVGSKLLLAFEQEIAGRNISGLHIMTSSESPNVSFYHKAGFAFKDEREWSGGRILFMGKKLQVRGDS